MSTFYEMLITKTGSNIGEEKFSVFDEETKIFDTAEDAKKWLIEQYGIAKRSQMYQGDGKESGYVYEFENGDWSHSPVENWIQQDWVTFHKMEAVNAFDEVKYEIPESKN